MTTTAPILGAVGFPDVDATGEGEAYIGFLDRQAERMRARQPDRVDALGLQPGDHVLDVGCGPATWTFDMEAQVGPRGRAVGVDFSDVMITEATARATARQSRAEFRQGDVRCLDVPDDLFDVTTCSLLLLHIDDVARAVAEMVRVTKPGGRVIAAEPDHQMSAWDGTDPVLTERVMRGYFSALRSPRIGRQLHGLFVQSGLVDVQVVPKPIAVTDHAAFRDVFSPEQAKAIVLQRGIASEEEIDAVFADFATRGAAGTYFGCLMTFQASGAKPM